jgi:hypothetical protein
MHVEASHGSMFEFLLGLDKKLTRLTDLQKRLLQLFHSGLPDNEVVKELDGGAPPPSAITGLRSGSE